MEGYGVVKIMESLKIKGYKVTKIIHDKDSSTLRNVMDIYEDVEEVLCLREIKLIFKFDMLVHGCKNFRKKLEKVEKKYPALKKLASRSAKAMKKLIKDSQGNETIFVKEMDMKIDHYFGIHNRCIDPESSACQNLKKIDDIDAKNEFMVF